MQDLNNVFEKNTYELILVKCLQNNNELYGKILNSQFNIIY